MKEKKEKVKKSVDEERRGWRKWGGKKRDEGENLEKKKRLSECYGKYRKQMGIDKQWAQKKK